LSLILTMYINQPFYAPRIDVINPTWATGTNNFKSGYTTMHACHSYAPTIYYPNTMQQVPLQAPALLRTSDSQVDDSDNTEIRVMRTPFCFEYWNQIVEPNPLNHNFCGFPYNGGGLAPEPEYDNYPFSRTGNSSFLVKKRKGTGLVSKDGWRYQQRPRRNHAMKNMSQAQLPVVEHEFQDPDEFSELSLTLTKVQAEKNEKTRSVSLISNPTEVKQKRNNKTPSVLVISRPMLTTVEQEIFSEKLMDAEHVEECGAAQVLSNPKEPCKTDEKTPKFNLISEEQSLDESIIDNPNPNEWGGAYVSWETSSDVSLESKGAESTEAMVLSHSLQSTSSEEIPISDFMVNSQTSSESSYEIREAIGQSLIPIRDPTPDLKSKHATLVVSASAIEEELLIKKPRIQTKYRRAVTVKQLPLSHMSPITPSKFRKCEMKNKKQELRDMNKIQTLVMKQAKPKDFLNPKNRQSSCGILKEYVLRLSLFWITSDS